MWQQLHEEFCFLSPPSQLLVPQEAIHIINSCSKNIKNNANLFFHLFLCCNHLRKDSDDTWVLNCFSHQFSVFPCLTIEFHYITIKLSADITCSSCNLLVSVLLLLLRVSKKQFLRLDSITNYMVKENASSQLEGYVWLLISVPETWAVEWKYSVVAWCKTVISGKSWQEKNYMFQATCNIYKMCLISLYHYEYLHVHM